MLCVEFPISAVHGFKWVNSCFESCRHCDWWTLKLIDYFCGQSCSLWLLRCPLNGGWIRVSGPRKSVPSIEVTNTKIMSTFFRDQILCPLNGGVPKERFHCLHCMYNSVRAAMSLSPVESLYNYWSPKWMWILLQFYDLFWCQASIPKVSCNKYQTSQFKLCFLSALIG